MKGSSLRYSIAALTIAVGAPALAQSAPAGDPFIGMSPAGHVKAQALNERIESLSIIQIEQAGAALRALQHAAAAEPLDLAKLREAARKYEEVIAQSHNYTVEWVELAASLSPSDRAIILRRLPRIGGIMRPPLVPPLPPKPFGH